MMPVNIRKFRIAEMFQRSQRTMRTISTMSKPAPAEINGKVINQIASDLNEKLEGFKVFHFTVIEPAVAGGLEVFN